MRVWLNGGTSGNPFNRTDMALGTVSVSASTERGFK
jgi:hypothetical protein